MLLKILGASVALLRFLFLMPLLLLCALAFRSDMPARLFVVLFIALIGVIEVVSDNFLVFYLV